MGGFARPLARFLIDCCGETGLWILGGWIALGWLIIIFVALRAGYGIARDWLFSREGDGGEPRYIPRDMPKDIPRDVKAKSDLRGAKEMLGFIHERGVEAYDELPDVRPDEE